MTAIDLRVDSRQEGAWAVLEVEGEVDIFTAPKLRERLVGLIDSGRTRVLVDLDRVSFMDSTGLGTLVGGLKRIKEADGTLALVCTSRPVLRLLTITGLNAVFPVHDSVGAAVGG